MLWQLAEPEQSEMNLRRGFAAITDPRFPDYIPQRMRVIAENSGPQLRLN